MVFGICLFSFEEVEKDKADHGLRVIRTSDQAGCSHPAINAENQSVPFDLGNLNVESPSWLLEPFTSKMLLSMVLLTISVNDIVR